MVPRPKPFNQGDILVQHSFGSTEGQSPNHERITAELGQARQDDNSNQNLDENQNPNPLPISPKSPVDNASFFQEKQRDPRGHLLTRVSPSNCRKADPDGFMMREGDLLDRTFDNVENFACRRTSASTDPPPPIFTCSNPKMHEGEAYDIVALSSAKQYGNAIEINDGEFDEELGNTQTSQNQTIKPVNSIVEDRSGENNAPSTGRGSAEGNGAMLDNILGSVQKLIWREEYQASSEKTEDSARGEPEKINDGGDANDSDSNSPIALHSVVADPQEDGLANSCDSIFSKAKWGNTASDTPTTGRSSNDELYLLPTPGCHDEISSSAPISKPRAGMILLADGTIMVPRHLYQKYQTTNSIRMSREHSLLDMVSRSGKQIEEEEDRLAALRQKKRSIEKRVRTTGGSQTIIPRHGEGEEVQLSLHQKVSIEELEKKEFWKQVAFAATILLVACGLIVFAMSFFWPTPNL